MVNLQCIHLIRQYLTQDTMQTLVLGTVMSHLDYSNAIFSGLPVDLANLQRIQNAGAKLVLQKDKLASSTECLCALHWLPIRERIDYKMLTLVIKSLNYQAPDYLQDLLCKCPKMRSLCILTVFTEDLSYHLQNARH